MRDGLNRRQMKFSFTAEDWWMVGLELGTVSGRLRTKDERRGPGCLGPQRMLLFVAARQRDKGWPSFIFLFFFRTGTSIADGHRPNDFSSKHHKLAPGLPFSLPLFHEEAPETTQCSSLDRKFSQSAAPDPVAAPLQCRPILLCYCA